MFKHNGVDIDPSKLNETIQVKSSSLGALSLKESDSGENFIMPRIESIHAGATANHVYYPAEKLKGDKSLGSGVYSWTQPYAKPVIYNHDLTTEVTGRIERAAYSEYTQAGKPGIIVVPKISEKKAIEAVRDGRLLTVSIGAETDAAVCSICGTDIIAEGYCGHMKGEEYDGEVAQWIAGNIYFQELSWVNQPADSNAFIIDSDVNKGAVMADTSESMHKRDINEYYGVPNAIPLTESVASDITEKEDIEVMNKENKLSELKKATQEAEDSLKDTQETLVEEGEEDEEDIVEDDVDSEEEPTDPVEPEEEPADEDDKEDGEDEGEEEPEVEPEPEVEEIPSTEIEDTAETEIPSTEIEDNAETEIDSTEIEDNATTEVDSTEIEDTAVVDEADDNQGNDNTTLVQDGLVDTSSDEAIKEATNVMQKLQGSNKILKEQVSLLTTELKESYVNEIITKHDGDLSESYIDTLRNRKLESLKETVEDLESGFLKIKPVVKEKKSRVVTKVDSPIKENNKSTEIKELTEKEQINNLSKLFKF